MAFYSVRVNENGTEIESSNTMNVCPDKNIINENDSVRGSTVNLNIKDKQSNIFNGNVYKTIKYINCATSIEKEVENPNKNKPILYEDDDSDIESNRTSTSIDEISNHQYQSHIIMENGLKIPNLELSSNESYPLSNDTSYSYSNIKEITRIIKKPDAYNEWIKAKKISKIYEEERKKQQDERKEMEKIQKKEIAEKKYREWLKKKYETKLLENDKKRLEIKVEKPKEVVKFNNTISAEDKEKCFKIWFKNKRDKEKQLQKERKEKLLQEQEQKNERKEQADILYNDWLKTVPFKPKPVPLNKGLFTFKGTISDIYINPEPWHKEYIEVENTNSL